MTQVIAPYFGAFGPPTLGHYEAMKMSALAHLNTKDFADKKIIMMWMPTAAGSKTHLLPTQNERIAALNVFNGKLRNDPELKAAVDSGKLEFVASTIEYEIFAANGVKKAAETGKDFTPGEGKGDTSTIFTLLELSRRKEHPTDIITVTMGIDNLLDLPWWYRSYQYPQITNHLYIAERALPPVGVEPTADEAAKVFIEPGKLVSVKKINGLYFRAVDPIYPVPIKGKIEDYPDNGYRETGYSLETYRDTILPELEIIKIGEPKSTSSSILRCVMKKLIEDKPDYNPAYKNSFRKLVGIDYDSADAAPWKAMLAPTSNFLADTPEKCAPVYAELESAGSVFGISGGRRRLRKSKKRSHRKSRKSKKSKRSSK